MDHASKNNLVHKKEFIVTANTINSLQTGIISGELPLSRLVKILAAKLINSSRKFGSIVFVKLIC
jgi:hypothetical protein